MFVSASEYDLAVRGLCSKYKCAVWLGGSDRFPIGSLSVCTVLAAAPDVAVHLGIAVLGTNVNIGGKQELEVFFSQSQGVAHGV